MRLAFQVTVVQYNAIAAETDTPVMMLSVALGTVYSPLFIETIYGKTVLNCSFFGGYRFCRSNRSVIGLRKACAEVFYETEVNFSGSMKSFAVRKKHSDYTLTYALQT